jgi:hypothetical protein
MYDTLFRNSDPRLQLYRGYFVINTQTDNWMECDVFRVNKVEITAGQFRRWLWSDSLPEWLNKTGPMSDEDVLEGIKLAQEAALYDLVDIPPYQFQTYITARIRAQIKSVNQDNAH